MNGGVMAASGPTGFSGLANGRLEFLRLHSDKLFFTPYSVKFELGLMRSTTLISEQLDC